MRRRLSSPPPAMPTDRVYGDNDAGKDYKYTIGGPSEFAEDRHPGPYAHDDGRYSPAMPTECCDHPASGGGNIRHTLQGIDAPLPEGGYGDTQGSDDEFLEDEPQDDEFLEDEPQDEERRVLAHKAKKCVRIAEEFFGRRASLKQIEDQALHMMDWPNRNINKIYNLAIVEPKIRVANLKRRTQYENNRRMIQASNSIILNEMVRKDNERVASILKLDRKSVKKASPVKEDAEIKGLKKVLAKLSKLPKNVRMKRIAEFGQVVQSGLPANQTPASHMIGDPNSQHGIMKKVNDENLYGKQTILGLDLFGKQPEGFPGADSSQDSEPAIDQDVQGFFDDDSDYDGDLAGKAEDFEAEAEDFEAEAEDFEEEAENLEAKAENLEAEEEDLEDEEEDLEDEEENLEDEDLEDEEEDLEAEEDLGAEEDLEAEEEDDDFTFDDEGADEPPKAPVKMAKKTSSKKAVQKPKPKKMSRVASPKRLGNVIRPQSVKSLSDLWSAPPDVSGVFNVPPTDMEIKDYE